jgi:AcrR family transcriptional regulator
MLTVVTFCVTIVNMIKKYTKKQKKQQTHGDLANSLIEIAVEQISESKSTEFALRELASKLGVSHAAAYRHFKNKHALLETIALRGYQKMNIFFLERLETSKDPLGDMARAYIQFALSNPGYYRVMFAVDFGKELNTDLHSACQGSFHALLEIMGKKNKINACKSIYTWSVVHGLVMLILDGQINTALNEFSLDLDDLENQIIIITKNILK